AAARAAGPAQEETDHLPHRIQAKATRHDRIILEMAAKKPEVRLHVELGPDEPLAIFPTGLGNFTDAVEHQHRRQRQLCVARAKQFAAGACQQILVFVTAAPFEHGVSLFKNWDEALLAKWTRFGRQASRSWSALGCHPQARTLTETGAWRLPLLASGSRAGLSITGPAGGKAFGGKWTILPIPRASGLGVLASCEKLASVGIPSYISRKCLSASPEASGWKCATTIEFLTKKPSVPSPMRRGGNRL